MEIKIAPEIIIGYARNLKQYLPYEFFTHPNKFVTLAVLLFEKIGFFVIRDFFVSLLSAVAAGT